MAPKTGKITCDSESILRVQVECGLTNLSACRFLNHPSTHLYIDVICKGKNSRLMSFLMPFWDGEMYVLRLWVIYSSCILYVSMHWSWLCVKTFILILCINIPSTQLIQALSWLMNSMQLSFGPDDSHYLSVEVASYFHVIPWNLDYWLEMCMAITIYQGECFACIDFHEGGDMICCEL